MRIGFSGVPSTGKSTLAKAISNRTGLPWLEEQFCLDAGLARVEREDRYRPGRAIHNLTPAEDLQFQYGLVEKRLELDGLMPNHVTDNSPLDNLNHLYLRYHSTMPADCFSKWKLAIEQTISTYDIIFHLPYGLLPIVDDGRRHTNLHFIETMNFHLRGLLEYYEEKVFIVELWETDLNKRIEAVMQDYKLINGGILGLL